jgi:hypothetical protein
MTKILAWSLVLAVIVGLLLSVMTFSGRQALGELGSLELGAFAH